MLRNTRGFLTEAPLIVNIFHEILMNYTMIHQIWQHHRVLWGETDLRKVRVKRCPMSLTDESGNIP